MAAPLLLDGDLWSVRLRITDSDVVWLRSVLEAYDGLASVHGDGSGVLHVVTTKDRACELVGLLSELRQELRFETLAGPC